MWNDPQKVRWAELILDSYRHYTGSELIQRHDPETDACNLFEAPIIVVSHGRGEDPVLNYGNQRALDLWGVDWLEFTTMPSRLTAEPVNQAERKRMLEEAARVGYISHYEGVRRTVRGAKFRIHQAEIWNVIDDSLTVGQAASFSRWTFL